MNKIFLTSIIFFYWAFQFAFSQEKEPDTTRMNIGKTEIIFINHEGDKSDKKESIDTIDASPTPEEIRKNEAHWAGIDFGFNMLIVNYNQNQGQDYWRNDPASSFNFNFNFAEHKFKIFKEYVGFTTGLGLEFSQVSFRNNYILQSNENQVYASKDVLNTYSKNKLKIVYLEVPLMLEFNTNANPDKSFYFAFGVVGGVRIGSKLKLVGENNIDGKEFEQNIKKTYNLSSFKTEGIVRLGYDNWGAYGTFNFMPLFVSPKPGYSQDFINNLSFGLSYNF
ncbi:MAG: outer membrane beta-barrel protein [Flavobacteriia bacterium]|nr:outer membrane beta-barrel protein [Flavobacteriia bacterium]